MKFNMLWLVLGTGFGLQVQANQEFFSLEVVNSSNKETITIIGEHAVAGANIGGTPVKELPINIHVVNKEELERLKFVDPDELLDRIPGETQVRNLRIPDGGKGYTIPMLDGIPLENPYEGATQRMDRVNTQDIQRIEVIKGPASAVYANNAFGGVINIISLEAAQYATSSIWVEGGNFGRQRVGLHTSGQVNKASYFADANIRKLDGAREQSHNDREQVSAKLRYEFSDDVSLITRLEHFKEDTMVRGGLTAQQIDDNPRQAGSLSSATDLEQTALSIRLKTTLQTGSLDAFFVLREKDTVGLSRFRGPEDEKDIGVNSKLIYRYDFNEESNLVGGFETYHGEQDVKRFTRQDVQLKGDFRQFEEGRDIYAGFIQYMIKPIEELTLSAGLRYEDIRIDSGQYDNAFVSFNDVSPKLGLTYQINPSHLVWFGASQGFYAPDAQDLFDIETGNASLQAEESENIEIGLRGTIGALRYDTSYYHQTINQYLVTQEFVQNGLEFEKVTNAGKVTTQGVESVVEYVPNNSHWLIGLTHTYAKNIYDRFVSSDGDFSGNEFSRSPKHHLNTRIAWQPIDSLILEVEGDIYSSYFSDIANTPEGKFKRGERINLRISYQLGDWKWWLHGINLTDTLEDRATFRRGVLNFRTVDGRAYYTGVKYTF